MTRPRTLALLLVTALAVTSFARPVAADQISDKQAEAARIAKKLEELRRTSSALVELFNRSNAQLADVSAQVVSITAKLAAQDVRTTELRTNASAAAIRAYVQGTGSASASRLLGDLVSPDGVPREAYLAVLLGDVGDVTDEVSAVREDTAEQRQQLTVAKAKQEQLIRDTASKKKQADKSIVESNKLLATAQGELGELVRQEEIRRQKAAEEKARLEAEARILRERQTRTAALGVGSKATYNGPQYNYPAPSAAAARVVAAAKSQLGIPYVWATSNPGVSFDCSGLTKWAWAQAGVSMGHFTGAQWSAFPHVPMEALQPGDLVFFFDDVHHVGLYVGGMMMIEAPYTGANVRYNTILGGGYAGAVRPG